ncbi:LysM peptidoglycan-binding domain-containing protein [Bdellovibrio sp. KM01]|uniref:LysM peptidoglycan-binding domain-containing protein n=1 Tax=Bdellovibrio sp. KM01 TaxID=2748865 RepID=UPI0015E9F8ED|nr:LysM peptidoglycan-binding domain-containing protein [Bdellovibrio sp. KM01]QLY24965.1 LysM peptidoglycan-binding domain-containing protein [Bdellovibrio sp. KM01]
MKSFGRLLLSASFFVTSSVTAGEIRSSLYIVKTGDTLSNIADRVRGGHTYGKGENLEKILILNPHLKLGRAIGPGEQILIPVNDLRNVAAEETPKPAPVASPAPVAVAVAVQVPQPQQTPVATEEDDVNHHFAVKAGYQFTTLEANDNVTHTKAELNSDHDITAAATWSQKWSDGFKSLFSFSARNIEFQPSTNSAKKISNASKSLLGVGFGGRFDLDEKAGIFFSVSYGQELFLHGISTTNVSIDSANVSNVGLGFDFQLYRKGSTALGFAISGSYLGGASTDYYSIDNGSSYKALLFIRRDKGGKFLSFEVGAQQRTQNTSVSDLNETNVFGNFIYGFDLFNREKP